MCSIYRFLLATFLIQSLNAHKPLIESVSINDHTITVTINRQFHTRFLQSNRFFVEYDQAFDLHELDYALATVPFLLTVAPVIWISNQSYEIEEMDEDLYQALAKIQQVFQAFFP